MNQAMVNTNIIKPNQPHCAQPLQFLTNVEVFNIQDIPDGALGASKESTNLVLGDRRDMLGFPAPVLTGAEHFLYLDSFVFLEQIHRKFGNLKEFKKFSNRATFGGRSIVRNVLLSGMARIRLARKRLERDFLICARVSLNTFPIFRGVFFKR